MTEIPEHLLKRSKERRAAIGGDDAPSGESTAASAAVTPAADAAPASAAPAVPVAPTPAETAPPPKPVRPEVAAAQRRRKIPYWAMPVLAALPLWAYVYQGTLEPPPAGEEDPLVLGESVYGACSSCHGASGGGGTGPALSDVLETWPDFRDHIMWVKLGDAGWPADTYGANDKPKGVGMPGHEALSDAELAQVVLYERTAFGGLDPTSEEYVAMTEIAEGVTTLADAGLGEESAADGVAESDLEPG